MNSRKFLIGAMSLVVAAGAATAASAESTWAQNHPRRHEVNDRLHHQNERIDKERREGEISGAKAYRLHHADHRIRHEERAFARHDNGHITKGEQARLNHQENHVSNRIGK